MIPFYLERNLVEVDADEVYGLESRQKVYKVIDSRKMDKFLVSFNGKLYNNLIGWEGQYPPKVILTTIVNSEKILLFDGMIHGYDSAIGFNRRIVVRGEEQKYVDKQNENEFEVYMSFVYDTEDMDDEEHIEFYKDIFNNDKDWFISNNINDAAKLSSCCFTMIAIYVVNRIGNVAKILDEETA